MSEEIKKDLNSRMTKALIAYTEELKSVRTGRATPALLENIMVQAYGNFTPISQIGSITVQDTKTLSVQVWDAGNIKSVEKAINDSSLGVHASSEGQSVRVPLPPLSEERRKELAKVVSKYAEQAKISVRNIRRDGMDKLKKFEKNGDISKDEMHKISDDVQKMTDKHIKEIDLMLEQREKEILSI